MRTRTMLLSGAITGTLCFGLGITVPRASPEPLAAGTYFLRGASWYVRRSECVTILELSPLGSDTSSTPQRALVLGDVKVQPGQILQIELEAVPQ